MCVTLIGQEARTGMVRGKEETLREVERAESNECMEWIAEGGLTEGRN